jgi:hypothetical protein
VQQTILADKHDACLLELQNYYEAKLAILQEFFSRKLEIPLNIVEIFRLELLLVENINNH